MRLLLHIGSHKTGTTAIQRYLVSNRAALTDRGVHLAAASADGDSNVVANAVATGDEDTARRFFDAAVGSALRADASVVVVSAENFYAMAVVAAALAGRMPDDDSSAELRLVQRLRSVLPVAVTSTRIVGYFRRPDRFAESLYNQRIKYEAFDETFERYLQLVAPMFAYHRIASAWAEVFGREACAFTAYESVAGDIRRAFLRDALGIDGDGFVDEAVRDNERVSRDVLEFKRELNARTPHRERHLEYRIACQLEQRLNLLADEPRHFQEFMSPHDRAQFLQGLAPELGALQREFGLAAFPPAERGSEWAPYPGLSDARREQLRREHGRISARPAVRIERMRIRSSSALRRTPAGRKLLAAGRLLAR